MQDVAFKVPVLIRVELAGNLRAYNGKDTVCNVHTILSAFWSGISYVR